jgi:hypothetical protein
MNATEQLLFSDKAALEKNIEKMIWNVINEEPEANKELSVISFFIDFDVEITCDAQFNPYQTTLYSTATFDNLLDFIEADDDDGYATDFEDTNGINWDDDCSSGSIEYNKDDAKVEVTINGLGRDASEEAKVKFKVVQQLEGEKSSFENTTRLVSSLKRQLENAEQKLAELSVSTAD